MSKTEQTSDNQQTGNSSLGVVVPRLSSIQQNQLDKMETGRWYKYYEVGNGKTMQALCDKGFVEYVDKEIIYLGGYKPWKYDKEFRKVS